MTDGICSADVAVCYNTIQFKFFYRNSQKLRANDLKSNLLTA